MHIVVRIVVGHPEEIGTITNERRERSERIILPIADGVALPGVAQARFQIAVEAELMHPVRIELVDRRRIQTLPQGRVIWEWIACCAGDLRSIKTGCAERANLRVDTVGERISDLEIEFIRNGAPVDAG